MLRLSIYCFISKGLGRAVDKKRSGSIMYAPPQAQNLLTAELSTHTAATRPDQGRLHCPAGSGPWALQSFGIDRTLEFSINLPSDTLPA